MKNILLPEPCPICGKQVFAMCQSWNPDTSEPHTIEIECESEPDVIKKGWKAWYREHYRMPYVDWLPYQQRALAFVKTEFMCVDGDLILKPEVPA